ncbi:hypothetical protein AMELA_G00088920 [Ameiurus melas]|uniref:Glycosyltransferase family 92 protein n=1 Tax=Ameiurus melas TaxID=219545 RepID=A0A7J6AZ43_AMEME|nr:hypothetical protein AMELA_G00088920 [Ameiurus melas]
MTPNGLNVYDKWCSVNQRLCGGTSVLQRRFVNRGRNRRRVLPITWLSSFGTQEIFALASYCLHIFGYCGPDLEKVLHSYEEDGILEIIPWPIHHFLEPSKGWKYELHSGEVHYYGQQATINDCIHRNRQRSKYVILTDADEIIIPYQHSSLHQLMAELQQNNPYAVAFIFWAYSFSKEITRGSERFNFPQWRHVPGVNILRHIYKEPLKWWTKNRSKMIVDPRKVMQASVHTVYKINGKSTWVPSDLAIVMHTTEPKRPDLGIEKLIMDNKIWEYAERLIPNVNKVLHKSGILK